MNPLLKVTVKYGVIAGVLGTLMVLGLYYKVQHPFLVPVFFDFRIILFAIFIFFALKEFRDFHQQGVLYMWQGLIGSFIFILTFATVTAVGLFIFMKVEPEFLRSYVELSRAQLESLPEDIIQRIGKDVYQRNLELLPSTNEFDLATLYFMQCFMIGIFVSIIFSVILRRQPKT